MSEICDCENPYIIELLSLSQWLCSHESVWGKVGRERSDKTSKLRWGTVVKVKNSSLAEVNLLVKEGVSAGNGAFPVKMPKFK